VVAPQAVERFLDQFFGPGNNYWPGRNPDAPGRQRVQPFLDLFSTESEAPYILPRVGPRPDDRLVYIIPRRSNQAMTVREWVDAFVVPSHAPYSSHSLDDTDPIDAAVMSFVGHRNVLVVEVPDKSQGLWISLERLTDTIGQKPAGTGLAPIPLARMLADFDLALAAGDSAASAALLERLSGNGLSGSNYTYLVIKRLARLGNYGELLRLPDLKSVASSQPPVPVKDAILTAVYYTVLESPLESGDLASAKQALIDRGDLVPPLATGPFDRFGIEAVSVLAVAATALGDRGLREKLVQIPEARELLTSLVPAEVAIEVPDVEEAQQSEPEEAPSEAEEEPTPEDVAADVEAMEAAALVEAENDEIPGPETGANSVIEAESIAATPVAQLHSWPELVGTIAGDADIRSVLDEEPWRQWAPPAEDDDLIAGVIGGLDDASAARAWMLSGPFVDSDDYGTPAAKTAQEFINIALVLARFGPADLAGLIALTEIVLRSAPNANDYTNLVDDLNAYVGRWVSVERAPVALDLADLLARNAFPNPEARLRLVTGLLEPLSRQSARLSVDEIKLARLIDRELSLALSWDQPETQEAEATLPTKGNLLLYSLDPNTLARVANALGELAPGLSIKTSIDRVGSPQLREWSRRADFIVVATRCAKHAATGFIRANAHEHCVILEADGAGSASLLRAAIDAIKSGPATL